MADLKGYVTAAGQNFEALARQMGYPVQIGTIEIGDGVLPDSESPVARTNLVHYLKSFPAILEVDPVNPGQFIVSCNIPADDAINGAGYFIREMGCRLAGQGAGVLYAYRRISNDFKPLLTQGEAKSFIYKLRFIPSNGELLTPVIDPSIVFASVQYCDNKVASELAKRDHKQSVRVATTAAIALTATQTIDGVALAVGDRVLVKDQADAKQNGIYLVAAQAWTRTTDADHGTELNAGARVYVEEGAVNGTRVWYLVTAGAITIGTTLLQFKDEHPAASETVRGVTRYANQAEVDEPAPENQKDDAVITVKKLWAWVKQASESVLGMMKVATQAQTDGGTADDVAVTPKKLANHYRRGNAVGPVSQSGGIPTGAILEKGSNSNGNYIRWADGTQLCWVEALLDISTPITNVWGSTSGSGFKPDDSQWQFPAPFASVPFGWGNPVGALDHGIATAHLSQLATTFAQRRAWFKGSGIFAIQYFAIGRWY